MKIIIASRNYNPAHLSHIYALTEIYQSGGGDVFHRVNSEYLRLQKSSSIRNVSTVELFKLKPQDVFMNYSPSISVLFDSLIVRIFTRASLVYFLHEPFTGVRSYFKADFGLLKVLKITLAAYIVKLNCILADVVVLSSAKAFAAEAGGVNVDPKYKRVNLVFIDQFKGDAGFAERRYISYIGTIAEDHAFKEYLLFVLDCARDGLLLGYKFFIATKSEIPADLKDVVAECVALGRLRVVSGSPMTDEQINSYYVSSFAVWNAYKRSMQSGVLPKAYMFGAPVINCFANSSEYFADGVHGASIFNYSLSEFLDSISRIERNWIAISSNCRRFFLDNFDAKSQAEKFFQIVRGKNG